MTVFVDQRHGSGTVEHLDLSLFAGHIQVLHQTRSTPIDLDGQTTKKPPSAVDHARLATEIGDELDSFFPEPNHGGQTSAHQNIGQVQVGSVLSQTKQIIKKLFLGVGAKVRLFLLFGRDLGDLLQVLNT